jgi:copper homeostasis protein
MVESRVKVEICVGDIMSAVAAEAGGADRVELCADISVGGTTPSAGTIASACRRLGIPVQVLIRPRGGDFVYSELELAVMRRDIEVAKDLGAAGVVLGLLTRESAIDRRQTGSLIELARPMTVTFHKAFDQTPDPMEALDALVTLGVDRVLTSGGRETALDGVETLASLVDQAKGRIIVMAGGRLGATNLAAVVRRSGVSEVHVGSAAKGIWESAASTSPRPGSGPACDQTDAGRVATIVALVRGI